MTLKKSLMNDSVTVLYVLLKALPPVLMNKQTCFFDKNLSIEPVIFL